MASSREVAWRIFAGEFNASTLEHSTGQERSASYLVTPLGAKVNRLYVVGVLTDLEKTGTEDEPMYRARVSDPTGVYYISAGQYQPEAARALSRIKPPCFVSIIGKSRVYKPEGGGVYVSIRPEIIKEANENLRTMWVMDACKFLKLRIDAMEEAMKMTSPNIDELRSLGYSGMIAEGIIMAHNHYKGVLDIQRYRSMLADALKFILPEKRFSGMYGTEPDLKQNSQADEKIRDEDEDDDFDDYDNHTDYVDTPAKPQTNRKASGSVKTAAGRKEATQSQPATDENKTSQNETAQKDKNEEKVLKIISELDNTRNGVAYENIVEKTKKAGIKQDELEEIFNNLLDKGLIYEPILGRVKVVKGK